jgi:hypothetical protein
LIPTGQAFRLMNTYHITTFRTGPFQFLVMNKFSNPKTVYHIKIFNHAHPIPGSVTLIQILQPGAGVSVTRFRTIPGIASGKLFTVSDDTFGAIF